MNPSFALMQEKSLMSKNSKEHIRSKEFAPYLPIRPGNRVSCFFVTQTKTNKSLLFIEDAKPEKYVKNIKVLGRDTHRSDQFSICARMLIHTVFIEKAIHRPSTNCDA